MADHDHNPTTNAILRRTTAVFTTRHHLPTLLILSFFLFSLRNGFHNFTQLLTTDIDNDPFIQSQLTHTHFPPKPTTVLENLENKLHPLFLEKIAKNGLNDTSFVLDSLQHETGFARTIKIVKKQEKSKELAKPTTVLEDGLEPLFLERIAKTGPNGTYFVLDSFHPETGFARLIKNVKKEEKVNDLIKFDLLRVLYVIGCLTPSFVMMFVAFVVVHVWVNGVIFLMVVNWFLNNQVSGLETLKEGAVLGARRVCWYVIMRWAVRGVMTHVSGFYFFGWLGLATEDWSSFFKILVKMHVMPVSILPSWIKDFEEEVYGFMMFWFFFNTLLCFAYPLSGWMAKDDPTRTVGEVIDEGIRLLLRDRPANNLMYLEGIIRGPFGKNLITNLCGRVFGSVILSLLEVYFLVAWMMYYLSQKSLDAENRGVPFGNAELEAMLQHD